VDHPDDFDYTTATEEEIQALAAELPGLTLGDIPGSSFTAEGPARGRAEAGRAIEAYFGIPQNSSPEPDFPAAGIELKAVPLIEKSVGLRVDQRTVIAQINYHRLAEEDWSSASVRKKLRILFVFFERLRDQPKDAWPIRHVTLWQPGPTTEAGIEEDWVRVRGKILVGLAHELSEADGRILGPCTKGTDGEQLRTQPYSPMPAKPRAWALKPPFVLGIYEQSRSAAPDFALISELAELGGLLEALRAKRGVRIADLAREVGRPPSTAKDYAARVVREYVASVEDTTAEQTGAFPLIRAPRTTEEGVPYEAVSFPAFRHLDLVEEEWEDSLLLSYLEHMLFVPVVGATRSTPQGECIVGPPLYWRPSANHLDGISEEWTRFRNLIRGGRADKLPKESETTFIHVRPHGKDASDRDETPGGGTETKKSFWLNKKFVAEILAEVLPVDGG
jgi:DNA mismatch repair protein MutH